MPINKGFTMIVVCRKFRKFAPNLEVYVHQKQFVNTDK